MAKRVLDFLGLKRFLFSFQELKSFRVKTFLQRKRKFCCFLGGPESGKSTIFKQMRILHMNGFSDLDMINYRYLVYSNVIQAVSQLIEGAEHLQIPYDREIEVSKVVTKF